MEIEKKVIDNSEIETYNGELLTDKWDDTENIVETVPTEVDLLKTELEEWKTKYAYLLADLENTKKRYNKMLTDSYKYKEENFFKDLLSILDDFDNIRKFINDDTEDSDKKAILLVHTKLFELLKKYDLTKIYEENHPVFFNDEYDEAIFKIDVEDKELDNTIAEVAKFGYKYKDKILRYEQVVVNKFKENNE